MNREIDNSERNAEVLNILLYECIEVIFNENIRAEKHYDFFFLNLYIAAKDLQSPQRNASVQSFLLAVHFLNDQ